MDAGSYEIKCEAAGLMSGFYIYKLSAGTYSESRKMMLLK
jgi:hypothetical protein